MQPTIVVSKPDRKSTVIVNRSRLAAVLVSRARDRGAHHLLRARLAEHPRALGERGAGRDDIVDEQDTLSRHVRAPLHAVGAGDVRAAFGSVAGSGLRLRVALLMQRRRERKAELLRRRFRQQTRLIVPALAQSPAAQRHPRDEVVLPRQLRAHRAGNEAAVDLGIPGRAAEFVAQQRFTHITLVIERRNTRRDKWKVLPPAVLRKRQAGPAVRAEAVAARLDKIMAECAPRRIEQVEQECDHLHIAPHSPQSRARRPL